MFHQAIKKLLFLLVPFPGKTGHFEGKGGSYFQGQMIPQREFFPSEGSFTQFSLGGKKFASKDVMGNLGAWVDKGRDPLETPRRWSLSGLKCGGRRGCKPSCSADDGGTPARAIQASNQWMASPADEAWESPPPS